MSMQGEGTSSAGQLLVWDTSPLHHAIKAGRVDTLADLIAERIVVSPFLTFFSL
ncbi:hypothetical protein [Streptomyces hirsutus]|uniref:hypothetical protein n=1 Tax=Streptomyces hirsutus TaxID=35620 RepID=UPI0036D02021